MKIFPERACLYFIENDTPTSALSLRIICQHRLIEQ